MLFQDEAIEECTSDVKSEMTCKSSEDLDSGDEIPFTNAKVVDIRCGLLTAKLHMQHFTCPGIHRKCIEFEGKLISPRQFTIRAEKDKQKDWKGSIRLGRNNLRTLMEMKQLDFYNHAESCSLKCQSRNYIKNRKGGAEFSSLNDSDAHRAEISSVCDDVMTDQSPLMSSRKGSTVLDDFMTQMKVPGSASLDTAGFHVNIEDILSTVQQLKNNNNTHNNNLNHPEDCGGKGLESQHRQSSRHPSSADLANNNYSADTKDFLAASFKNGSSPLATLAYVSSVNGGDTPSSSTAAPTSVVDSSPSVAGSLFSVEADVPLNGSALNNNNHDGGSCASPKNNFKARSPSRNGGSYNGCNGKTTGASSQASKWPSIINRCVPSALNSQQQQPPASPATTTASTICPPAPPSLNGTTTSALATDLTNDAALVMLLQSLIDPQKLRPQQPPVSSVQVGTPATTTQRLVSNNNNNNCQIPASLSQPSVSNANNTNVNNLLQNLALLNSIGGGSTLTSQTQPLQQQFSINNNNLNFASLTGKPLFKQSPGLQINGGNNNVNFEQQQLQELLLAAGLQKPQQPALPRIGSLFPSQQPTLQQPVSEDMPLNASRVRTFMETNPVAFWSQMRELGILEDLLNTVVTTVDELKQLYLTGNAATEEFAAQKLTSVTNVLDLSKIFSAKIRDHHMRATLESNLIHKELQAIVDLQRKAEEQKRRLETAKRKTQLLDKDDDENAECKRMHLERV